MATKQEMRQFNRIKSMKEIRQQCQDQKVPLDEVFHLTHGSDCVTVGRAGYGQVAFNTFNGRFSGRTPAGVPFYSFSIEHENEPWYQALLAFFYADK